MTKEILGECHNIVDDKAATSSKDTSNVRGNMILAVDDDLYALQLITEILSYDGFQVETANSGELALQSVVQKPPQLILLDVNMPGMDGFEVCERLKAHDGSRNIPVLFVSGTQNRSERVRGFSLGAVDFISKPFQSEELLARIHSHLELNRLRMDLEAQVAVRTDELCKSYDKIRDLLEATVHALATALEIRDPYTYGHQLRVSALSRAIATEMALSIAQREGLCMAAAIHDIGKIYIPVEILSKPLRLTDLEFSLIKMHSQWGYDILKGIEFPWPVARMVLEHHERMDGSGYPNGLTGDNSLLESHILATSDVVEAMASHRPYRPSLGINAALDEIARNKGVHYDPDVVDACLLLFNEKGYKLKG